MTLHRIKTSLNKFRAVQEMVDSTILHWQSQIDFYRYFRLATSNKRLFFSHEYSGINY